MTNLAPRIDADELRRAVSLLDLLPPGTEAKRIGRDAYVTLCLFHSEDRPSMRVTLHRGVWRFRCFPCGASGDVLDLVQRTRGVTFQEALRALADGRTFDMTVPTRTKRRRVGFTLVCSTAGCISSFERETLADVVLNAVCAGWIVCAAEDAAFDYCPGCSGRMRA